MLNYLAKVHFDEQKVLRAIGRGEAKVLNNFGRDVRQKSRRLAGKKGGRKRQVSAPGKPPTARSPEPNLRTIAWYYDPQGHVVITGPIKFNQRNNSSTYARGTVPRVMEKGGQIVVREKLVGKHWMPYGRRRPGPRQPIRERVVNIAARPFMRPALEAAAEKFPDLWANSIK